MTEQDLKNRLVVPHKDSISQFKPFYQITPKELQELNEQYHEKQLKLHDVSNSALEQAKIQATKRIKAVTDTALYEYQRALENGRCEECNDLLVKSEDSICEDCLCPV